MNMYLGNFEHGFDAYKRYATDRNYTRGPSVLSDPARVKAWLAGWQLAKAAHSLGKLEM